jgi:excisionase family DNA binding protein
MKMSSYEPQGAAGSRGPIELLTIPEVAKLLKISTTSVRRLQQGRHVPFFKVGGSVRFATSDILEYLKKERVDSMH